MLLTDVSKVFDCLVDNLLITKLNAYGFDNNALLLINNYFLTENSEQKFVKPTVVGLASFSVSLRDRFSVDYYSIFT